METIQNSAIKITVKGDVQGVGFRFYISREADLLRLKGYVKNCFNGDVEIYAEGRKEFLEELARKAKLGPSSSYVDSIKIEWLEFKNKFDKFEIR